MSTISEILKVIFSEREKLDKNPQTQWGVSVNSPAFDEIKSNLSKLESCVKEKIIHGFHSGWRVKYSIGIGRSTPDHHLSLLPVTISYQNFTEKPDLKMVFLTFPLDYPHEAQYIELPNGTIVGILEVFPVLK